MSAPVISVITSIYDGSKFLFDFLCDVKRQSIFKDIEVLLLDANEDDRDFKTIEPFLDFPQFKYHRVGKCSIYEAWNKGTELAASSLLTNWNIDDRRAYNSLEHQVSFMKENEDCDVCYGPTIISEIPNEIFEFTRFQATFPAWDGTKENMLKHNSPHCLPVWRKSIHERFGYFDTSYRYAADYDLWLRVLLGGGNLRTIGKTTGLYFRNPEGLSSGSKTLQAALEEVWAVRKKYA